MTIPQRTPPCLWYYHDIYSNPFIHITVILLRRLSPSPWYWLAVWLSGNALVSINVVTLRRARLVPGWVTVFGKAKPSQYVTSHPSQLSLAVPLWVCAMSTSLGCEGNRRSGIAHTGHASQTIVVYPPTGSTAYERKMSTAPTLLEYGPPLPFYHGIPMATKALPQSSHLCHSLE